MSCLTAGARPFHAHPANLIELLEPRLFLSSVLLNPTADAYAQAGRSAATNYGNATSLFVHDDTKVNNDRQTYLRFDTSGVNDSVQSAVLQLTPVSKGPQASSLTIRVRLLSDAADGWIEGNGGKDNNPAGELTWNNKPAGTGLAITLSGASIAVGTPISIDVSSLLSQSLNTNGLASFHIDVTSPANSKAYVAFASRQHATAGYRPTLTLTTESSNFLGLGDAALASLTQSLASDGSIVRTDLVQILRSTGSDDAIVDATEFADLKTILNSAATLNMPNYVKVLGNDVVNGNLANLHYQGQSLGNLYAGSSQTQLNLLVDKWFYGTDHPAAGGYTYRSVAGSLFVNGPAYTDMRQGYLGDCYFIASLGAIAKSSTAAAQSMFIDNGDGTWTVRFYANQTPDFVTVDRFLPTNSSGNLVYASVGANYANAGNELWIALAEKAYAQWNETGKEGRDGQNNYASLEGGWMFDVNPQVLGQPASTYWWFASSYKTYLIDAIANNKAVTIATNSSPTDGLYGPHAYVVTAYNATTDTFSLYNPWGTSHPGPLTWTQLQANCQCFVISDTSGTVPPTNTSGTSVAMSVSGAPTFTQPAGAATTLFSHDPITFASTTTEANDILA